MKLVYGLSKMGVCLGLVLVLVLQTIHSVKGKHTTDLQANKTRPVYLYRLIQWCIIGKGEYMLDDWPLNQFKPFLWQSYQSEIDLQNTNQEKIDELIHGKEEETEEGAEKKEKKPSVDVWAKYDLKFSAITCTAMNAKMLGDNTGKFLNRMHVQFKPKSESDKVSIQGLIIQAVHAPFGIGFPFGVFDVDEEFKCNDQCKFSNNSVILGCLSRPDVSPMHPTVGVFHFKRKVFIPKPVSAAPSPSAPAAAGNPPPSQQSPHGGGGGTIHGQGADDQNPEIGIQSEFHWNFKWANIPCSSSRLVEFWVMMVLDFEKKVWTVKKFGPYDLNKFELTSTLEAPMAKDVPQYQKTKIKQPGLPTPIIPDCYPFKEYPLLIKPDFKNGRPRVCFRRFYKPSSYDAKKCKKWENSIRFPKTPQTNALTMVNNAGFTTNNMNCHGGDINLTPNTTLTRVRVEGDFDAKCIRRFPGPTYERLTGSHTQQPHKLCLDWQARFKCLAGSGGKEGDELHFDRFIPPAGSQDGNRSFPSSQCLPCLPVTEEITEPPNEEVPFFKRGAHGVLMIYAFFFFNPVSLNVARFYKETLHERQVKGWRCWLVIHVGFALMASGISYIGYTFPSFKEMDMHIYLGYGAMIGVSSGVITGWIRHKNQIIKVFMFYLHALSGYVGWAFAIASFVFAPSISALTRLVSYSASGICLAAMAIMTIHICTVDRSIGVRPSRSHIPIVEIRFDDIVPPKSLCRKIFLYVYILMQFLICFGMLVL